MKKKTVIVIGAGPAGLAAALSALKEGAHVVVLEHMEAAGKKLLLTGNGQCNLSNTEIGPSHYHGNTGLIESVIGGFSYDDAVMFWKQLGIETETVTYRHETCGYLYPKDHKAASVRNALTRTIDMLGGELVTDCKIKSVAVRSHSTGRESGETAYYGVGPEKFEISTSKGSFSADALVFATGSNAYPATGSDSSIYPILKEIGIVQKTWLPALTALKTDAVFSDRIRGIRADATVILCDLTEEKEYRTPDGEVQFRDHFVSGLPVLQLSRYASIGLKDGHRISCRIYLHRVTNKDGKKPFQEIELNITGTEGFEHAITCSGGVPAEELNVTTLESLKVPGVCFAGEMIDVDGDCGGFNLHFAFASGLLAGRNAAK